MDEGKPSSSARSSRIAVTTGLTKPSVANDFQLVTLDREDLEGSRCRIPRRKLQLVLAGTEILLGR